MGWAPKEYNPDDKQSVGPEQTGTEVGAPQSGFVWDEASGYYYDAASGFYYDGNTGMYLGYLSFQVFLFVFGEDVLSSCISLITYLLL